MNQEKESGLKEKVKNKTEYFKELIGNSNVDKYYWYDTDSSGKRFKAAAKIVDRTSGAKNAYWCYWNGMDYVPSEWFELNEVRKPDIPLFYTADYEKFKESDRVMVCEGEKDVHTLASIGRPAVTLQSGATKIKDSELSKLEIFKGKTVCIVGDNDDTGKAYAEDFASKLYKSGYAKEIGVANISDIWSEAPDKGDVTDFVEWVRQGKDPDVDIASCIDCYYDKHEPYRPKGNLRKKNGYIIGTFGDILRKEPDPLEWLVEGILPDQGLIQLAGTPKLGKSIFALQLSVAIAQGGDFLGRNIKPGKVLYYDYENSERILQNRLDEQFGIEISEEEEIESEKLQELRDELIDELDGVDNGIVLMQDPDSQYKRLNEGFVEDLDDNIKEFGPDISLVVIDTMKYIQTESRGNNANLHDANEFNELKQYANNSRIPILLINHTTKSQITDSRDPFEKSLGSQSVFGAMDTQIILKETRSKDNLVEETQLFVKGKEVAEQHFIIEMIDGCWEIVSTVEERLEVQKRKEFLNKPLVKAIRILMEHSEKWSGTSSDLIKEAKNFGCEIDVQSRGVTDFLNKLTNQEKLKRWLDLEYWSPQYANGTIKKHIFRRAC